MVNWYIVTPCLQALPRLAACVRSVADQAGDGLCIHHHVQDGGSADGSTAWLERWQQAHTATPGYRFTYESAPDRGMYDALNKAWAQLPETADFTAHLNADEQYLPGALRQVSAEFAHRPAIDILETTHIVCDRENRYHCHRRPVQPHAFSSRMTAELTTCTTFWRASAFRRLGLRFDLRYRIIEDLPFMHAVVASGIAIAICPRLFTSAYTVTGRNMGWTPAGWRELRDYEAAQPLIDRLLHPLPKRWVNLRRRLVDCICPPPQELCLYHGDESTRRCERIEHPTCIWKLNFND
ncbi:MAG: glycosyltransferase [Akkermansia sp.]